MNYNGAEYNEYGIYRGWQLYYTKNWKVNRYLAFSPNREERVSKNSLAELQETIDKKIQDVF